MAIIASAAANVISVTAKKCCTTRPRAKISRKMPGTAIVVDSGLAQVASVSPSRISTVAAHIRPKPDGLKMCVRRPSLRQRRNSLPSRPAVIIANCQTKKSSRNQMNRLVDSTIGVGPELSRQARPRVHDHRPSNAYR